MTGGWAPDPWRRAELRYFDGTKWTEHVSSLGRQYTDPTGGHYVAAPSSAPAPKSSVTERFKRRSLWQKLALGSVAAFSALIVGIFVATFIAVALGANSKSATDSPGSSASAAGTAEDMAEATKPAPTTTLGPTSADVARCNNGSYSSNLDFSATCSSNDGVAEWLARYGQCVDGAVFEMSDGASCDSHDGFQGLLPTDYVPVPPTTLPPPAVNAICDNEQDRRDALVCAPTGFGLLWIEAPFASEDDQVLLLADELLTAQVGDMGIGAAKLLVFDSYRQTYLCVTVGLKNFDDSNSSYNMFDFRLLTPSGGLEYPTIPLTSDLNVLLSAGELSPDGSKVGEVCFDEPQTDSGRFAVVYSPFQLFDDQRALFYFDR